MTFTEWVNTTYPLISEEGWSNESEDVCRQCCQPIKETFRGASLCPIHAREAVYGWMEDSLKDSKEKQEQYDKDIYHF